MARLNPEAAQGGVTRFYHLSNKLKGRRQLKLPLESSAEVILIFETPGFIGLIQVGKLSKNQL